MSITVNLWSSKSGEIKRFMKSFYQGKLDIKNDSGRWIQEFRNPLESVDMISAVMDNLDKFEIVLYVQVNK